MKAYLQEDIIAIDKEDLPAYKKGGSIVRNSYFWALKAISCHAPRSDNWEFDREVWIALSRILLSFAQSGYLGYSETLLEFTPEQPIPECLQLVSTFL
jgi:hypothetical protein